MVSLLCSARSGSTNLSKYLSNVLKLKLVITPFSDREKTIESLNKNYFYKMMIHHKPNVYDSMFEFGSNVITKFDKVILLDRENKLEQAESLSFKFGKYGKDMSKYHTREPYENIDEKMVNESKIQFEVHGQVLKRLSSEFDIPLFTYEGIYYGDELDVLSDYLNVEIDSEMKTKYIENFKRERMLKKEKLC